MEIKMEIDDYGNEDMYVVMFDSVEIDCDDGNDIRHINAILFAIGGEGQDEDMCDVDYVDFLRLNLNFDEAGYKLYPLFDESEFIHPTLDRIPDDEFKKLNSVTIRFDFEKLLGNTEVYIMQEVIKKLNTLGFDCKIDGGFIDHDGNRFVKYKIIANKIR